MPGPDHGAGSTSQLVTSTYQYEGSDLLGRLTSVSEQEGNERPKISERRVYAANTEAEIALNLAGRCVSHYDTAGLTKTDSVALTGVPRSISRRFFKSADNPGEVVDWQGDNASDWMTAWMTRPSPVWLPPMRRARCIHLRTQRATCSAWLTIWQAQSGGTG